MSVPFGGRLSDPATCEAKRLRDADGTQRRMLDMAKEAPWPRREPFRE